jgi:hypothetical protein
LLGSPTSVRYYMRHMPEMITTEAKSPLSKTAGWRYGILA